MPATTSVPGYEPMLAAYHRAFAAELRAMIGAIPLSPGQSVLDMACGDGAYSPWLAERVGASGRVVAVDVRDDYLDLARRQAAHSPFGAVIEFATASIETLPFEEDSFDLVWCAQSLYSLPEPVEALRRMLRVTKPGGVVAVLEGDTIHHLILPWPVEVELSVRAAEFQGLSEKTETPRKFYVGRLLRHVFRQAGLERIEARTFATDRPFPLGPDERIYFAESLKRLSDRVSPFLAGPIREAFHALADPDSSSFLLDDPDFSATCVDHLVWGRKPMD